MTESTNSPEAVSSTPAPEKKHTGPLVIGRSVHYRDSEGNCHLALVTRGGEHPTVAVYQDASGGWSPRHSLKWNPTATGACHWPVECPEQR